MAKNSPILRMTPLLQSMVAGMRDLANGNQSAESISVEMFCKTFEVKLLDEDIAGGFLQFPELQAIET